MAHYERVWSRHTARFDVECEWTYDDTDPCDHMDEGDAAEVRAKLESGEWVNCLFRVRVIDKATGETLGVDYLGGSVYADPRDFGKERKGSYLPDMVSRAIEEARQTVNTPRPFLRAA